jgi:hypothetical protein
LGAGGVCHLATCNHPRDIKGVQAAQGDPTVVQTYPDRGIQSRVNRSAHGGVDGCGRAW